MRKSAIPFAPFMTRTAFRRRIADLVQLELAGAPVEAWHDAQMALRGDMEAHASDAVYNSVEQFVRLYLREYDLRLKTPELRAAQLAGVREWLNDYDTSED